MSHHSRRLLTRLREFLNRRQPHRVALFLCAAIAFTPGVHAQGTDPGTGEPQVTAEQAALLEEVRALSATNPQAAMGKVRQALRPDASPALLFTLGALYAQTGKLPEAEGMFAEALAHSPDFLRARQNLASVLAQQEKYADAAREMRAVLKQEPDRHEVRLGLAGVLAKEGKHDEAIAELNELLGAGHDSKQARCLLASTHLLKEDHDGAIREFRALLSRYPDPLRARRNLAGLLLLQKKREEAALELARLLERDPDDHASRKTLASLYIEAERYPDAVRELELLLKAKPELHDTHLTLANIHVQLGNFEKAIEQLSKLTDLDPAQHDARENLAGLYLQREETAAAVQELRELLRRAPDRHEARRNLANILMQQQRYPEAITELNAWIDGHGDGKGEAWATLAFAYRCLGHADTAEHAYRQALRYDADSEDLRMGLVKSILDQGEQQRARPLIRQLLERDPLRPELWRLLVNVDLIAQQDDEAIVGLESARRFGVSDDESLLTLGDLLVEQELPATALDRYLEAKINDAASIGRLLRATESFVVLGKTDEAQRLLDRIAESGGALSGEQRKRMTLAGAQVLELTGKGPKALELYSKLLNENPLDARVLMAMGRLHQRAGDLVEALICYERAGRADKQFRATALVRQAQIAVDREEYQRAVTLLEQSLEVRHRPYVERYLSQVRRMLD